nr:uncharacterized protein LOC127315599 [Lolium perenne]
MPRPSPCIAPPDEGAAVALDGSSASVGLGLLSRPCQDRQGCGMMLCEVGVDHLSAPGIATNGALYFSTWFGCMYHVVRASMTQGAYLGAEVISSINRTKSIM